MSGSHIPQEAQPTHPTLCRPWSGAPTFPPPEKWQTAPMDLSEGTSATASPGAKAMPSWFLSSPPRVWISRLGPATQKGC